jgi:hypothetical protein
MYQTRYELVQTMWDQEARAGLDFLRGLLRSTETLELQEFRQLGDHLASYLVIGAGQKKTDIMLSHEFLSDLSKTAEYRRSAEAYVRRVAKRMANPHPMDFYCNSGVPIRVEIEWPFYPIPQRTGSVVHVRTFNPCDPSKVAICSVIRSHTQYLYDLRKDAFVTEAAVIRTVRIAVDSNSLTFYARSDHPDQLQQVRLCTQPRDAPELDVDRFIAGKVYWLAFRQGDKRTKVWIADEADAEYLGTDSRSLIRVAQVLEAQKMVVLDSTQEYASADEQLLMQADSFETGSFLSPVSQKAPRKDGPILQEWDCFICHASEDKDAFVRLLAKALEREGLKVWYDEFTLRVGDSLRREIDRGLRDSRYGVVVLSPPFFAKGWPQWELDGLVAKEVGGKKVILPVWHNVTASDVREYSPSLADKVAANSSEGISAVVAKLLEAIMGWP